MKVFEWIGKEDDFTCRIDGYVLRVEQMDEDVWWWQTSKGDEVIDQNFTSTEAKARQSAKEVYYIENEPAQTEQPTPGESGV